MKIDLYAVILDRKGKPVQREKVDLTLKEILLDSLEHIERNPSLAEKSRRAKLMRRLDKGDSDFAVEEISFMKECVGGYPWFPSVHENILDLLDPPQTT